MATEWYYRKGDRKFGPIDDAQLKALAESGAITIDDLVMREGHGQWVNASLVKGLFPNLLAGVGSQLPRASAPSPKQDDDALATMTVEQAKALSERDTLRLDKLTMLSSDVATALAAQKGSLSLNGLTSLSDEAAHALAKHRGPLSLGGLLTLTDEAVRALGGHSGPLSLNGLTSLSDQAAKVLSRFPHSLHLNGVATLSDAAANALASHCDGLWLEGLTTLSDSAAASLRGQWGLHWPDKFRTPANRAFLEGARSRSCYPVLRLVQGLLTVLGVIVCVLAAMASLVTNQVILQVIVVIAAIGVIVLLLIADGFFRMIVDAVDVLIEIGRHTAAGKSDDTPSRQS